MQKLFFRTYENFEYPPQHVGGSTCWEVISTKTYPYSYGQTRYPVVTIAGNETSGTFGTPHPLSVKTISTSMQGNLDFKVIIQANGAGYFRRKIVVSLPRGTGGPCQWNQFTSGSRYLVSAGWQPDPEGDRSIETYVKCCTEEVSVIGPPGSAVWDPETQSTKAERPVGPIFSWGEPYPINEWFWVCVVNKAPKIQENVSVLNGKVGTQISFEIPIIEPLTQIPESVSATGLPPGLSVQIPTSNAVVVSVETVQVQSAGPNTYQKWDGYRWSNYVDVIKYGPDHPYPLIVGTPTAYGTFYPQITLKNPYGSSSSQITIQIAPFTSPTIACGSQTAGSFFVGDDEVKEVRVGHTKMYP